jgi:hypothetical protein
MGSEQPEANHRHWMPGAGLPGSVATDRRDPRRNLVEQRRPPACRGTAEAKPERNASSTLRWDARLVESAGSSFRLRTWISAARVLRDGGGEAGARGALNDCSTRFRSHR